MRTFSRTLRMTNVIERRMFEHKTRRVPGFSSRYHTDRLVYYEEVQGPTAAIEREKALKGLLRLKKIALIESVNPGWLDLSADWFGRDARFSLPAPTSASRPDPSLALKDDGHR